MQKELGFLMEKLKDYTKAGEKYASILKKNGYKTEISHEAIMKMKKNLDELEQTELKPLKTKLEGYKGLPPSIELAQAELMEAEKQLERLTNEMTEEISALHV